MSPVEAAIFLKSFIRGSGAIAGLLYGEVIHFGVVCCDCGFVSQLFVCKPGVH